MGERYILHFCYLLSEVRKSKKTKDPRKTDNNTVNGGQTTSQKTTD